MTRNSKKLTVHFKNKWQEECFAALHSSDITFVTGIAGTGKTHVATMFAVQCLFEKAVKRVYITRPTVEAVGEKQGFLPGDIAAKVHPYLLPIYDCVDALLPNDNEEERKKIKEGLQVLALGFARGRTMGDAICILDEAQNATPEQLELWMTRMGVGAKLIITGDPGQSDIWNSPFADVLSAFKGMDRVAHYHFPPEANCRHPLVSEIVQRFARLKSEKATSSRD